MQTTTADSKFLNIYIQNNVNWNIQNDNKLVRVCLEASFTFSQEA